MGKSCPNQFSSRPGQSDRGLGAAYGMAIHENIAHINRFTHTCIYLLINAILRYHRVRTGHGKPGKSWNLLFQFPGLESHGI